MAKTKTNISEKNPQELTEMLAEKREQLRSLRFTALGSRLKDSSEPKKLRADVARIMTELGNRAA